MGHSLGGGGGGGGVFFLGTRPVQTLLWGHSLWAGTRELARGGVPAAHLGPPGSTRELSRRRPSPPAPRPPEGGNQPGHCTPVPAPKAATRVSACFPQTSRSPLGLSFPSSSGNTLSPRPTPRGFCGE